MILIVLRSLLTYIAWAILSFTFTILCITLALLPASIRYDNRLYFLLTSLWSKLMLITAGVQVTFKGLEHVPRYPHDPSIFVMNHASSLDIYVVECITATYPHVWMCKAIYAKIPLFNILLKRMHVLVNRDDPSIAVRALVKLYMLIRKKARHALLFPEGRRWSDGKIHPFLAGFATLAERLERPVIPVYIKGMHKILPRERWLIDNRACTVQVIIGEPMKMKKGEPVKSFADRIQTWFEQQAAIET
jgi:1-acyl-sn-glycerol-3-phosphate acyltransferase